MPRREAQGSRHELRSAQAHRRAALTLRQVRVGRQRPDAAVARDAWPSRARSALGVYSSARGLRGDGLLASEAFLPVVQAHSALTISSVIFLASPNSIMVLSR